MSWALATSDDILVGGQAVIEGVMMRSPKGYSVAVRRPDGSVGVIKDVLLTAGEKWRIFKLPVFRGIGVLGQAMVRPGLVAYGVAPAPLSAHMLTGDCGPG